MADVPAVSVVIPLYNKGPYIARALNSVLAQTFQDFEVIVVDDGSTDDGAEVVRSFEDPRIRLIQQENRGVSAARNRGIEAARAELVAFLDADDEWLPGFLETIMRLRRKFPEAGAYATAYLIQYHKRVKEVDIPSVPVRQWGGIITRFFKVAATCEPISSSSVCIPQSTFNEIGLFSVGRWWGEDTDMWGRIALHYSIAYSSNIGSIYHYGSINRANERRVVETDHPFIKVGLNYIENNNEVMSAIDLCDLKEYIEILKMKVAERALKSGDPKFARETIIGCDTKTQLRRKIVVCLMSCLPPDIYITMRTIKWKIL